MFLFTFTIKANICSEKEATLNSQENKIHTHTHIFKCVGSHREPNLHIGPREGAIRSRCAERSWPSWEEGGGLGTDEQRGAEKKTARHLEEKASTARRARKTTSRAPNAARRGIRGG